MFKHFWYLQTIFIKSIWLPVKCLHGRFKMCWRLIRFKSRALVVYTAWIKINRCLFERNKTNTIAFFKYSAYVSRSYFEFVYCCRTWKEYRTFDGGSSDFYFWLFVFYLFLFSFVVIAVYLSVLNVQSDTFSTSKMVLVNPGIICLIKQALNWQI